MVDEPQAKALVATVARGPRIQIGRRVRFLYPARKGRRRMFLAVPSQPMRASANAEASISKQRKCARMRKSQPIIRFSGPGWNGGLGRPYLLSFAGRDAYKTAPPDYGHMVLERYVDEAGTDYVRETFVSELDVFRARNSA